MAVLRALIVTVAFSLFAAACSSSDQGAAENGAMGAEAYGRRMVELMDAPVPEEDFPIGGSNVRIVGIFTVVEESLTEMKSLQPPAELRALHTELTRRFEAAQEAVASYLQHHGVLGEEIELEHFVEDAEIGPLIRSARRACTEWAIELRQLDVDVPAGACLV